MLLVKAVIVRSELERSVSLSAVIKCGWAHPTAPLGGDELWVEMCGLFSIYLFIYRSCQRLRYALTERLN